MFRQTFPTRLPEPAFATADAPPMKSAPASAGPTIPPADKVSGPKGQPPKDFHRFKHACRRGMYRGKFAFLLAGVGGYFLGDYMARSRNVAASDPGSNGERATRCRRNEKHASGPLTEAPLANATLASGAGRSAPVQSSSSAVDSALVKANETS